MPEVGNTFRAQVANATGTSIFGNMEYQFKIFQIAHDGRFMIEIVNNGPPATGYITNDQLDLLKGKKGVLEITKQVMMRGEPEYHLYYKQQPAGREVGYQEIVDQQKQKSIEDIENMQREDLIKYVARIQSQGHDVINISEDTSDYEIKSALRKVLDLPPAAIKTLEELGYGQSFLASSPDAQKKGIFDKQITPAELKRAIAARAPDEPTSYSMDQSEGGRRRRRKTKKSKRRSRKTRRYR